MRDKLLNIKSHDIDVALSTMTGITFAEQLRAFMDQHGSKYQDEAKRIDVSPDLRSLHQIAANPEKSKHLETVTTRMFGLDLDFVNLRKETYTDSRNPQMEFGTAEEDALRRDATVNALFYNLDTEVVEDFTGRGLDDMKARIIRTPLEPHQTFEDDPLRVLRLIRFACQLDFEILEDTLQAMSSDDIHQALRKKISRERVWVEVGKMFRGPNPYRSSVLIHDLGLYGCVFDGPNASRSSSAPEDDSAKGTKLVVYETLQSLELAWPNLHNYLHIGEDSELDWLLASYSIHGQGNAAVQNLQEALKPAKRHIDILRAATKNLGSIMDTLLIPASRSVLGSRAELGMYIYRLGESWRSQYLYAMLHLNGKGADSPVVIMTKCQALFEKLEELELLDAPSTKPIVNGEELKAALGRARPGKWMTTANQWLLEWQFGHPRSTKEDAVQMILGRRKELVEKYGMVCQG